MSPAEKMALAMLIGAVIGVLFSWLTSRRPKPAPDTMIEAALWAELDSECAHRCTTSANASKSSNPLSTVYSAQGTYPPPAESWPMGKLPKKRARAWH